MISGVIMLFFEYPEATVLLILLVAFIASIVCVLALELLAHLVRCAKVRHIQRGAMLYKGYDVHLDAEKVARAAQETRKVEE